MDGHRTLYVLRRARAPRERCALWLPIDLAAHYGFWLGVILFVAGGVGLGLGFTDDEPIDTVALWYCIGMIAVGFICVKMSRRVQRIGNPPDHELIIRRTPRR